MRPSNYNFEVYKKNYLRNTIWIYITSHSCDIYIEYRRARNVRNVLMILLNVCNVLINVRNVFFAVRIVIFYLELKICFIDIDQVCSSLQHPLNNSICFSFFPSIRYEYHELKWKISRAGCNPRGIIVVYHYHKSRLVK